MEYDKKTLERIAQILVEEMMEQEPEAGMNIGEMEMNLRKMLNGVGAEALKKLLEEKDETEISKKNIPVDVAGK